MWSKLHLRLPTAQMPSIIYYHNQLETMQNGLGSSGCLFVWFAVLQWHTIHLIDASLWCLARPHHKYTIHNNDNVSCNNQCFLVGRLRNGRCESRRNPDSNWIKRCDRHNIVVQFDAMRRAINCTHHISEEKMNAKFVFSNVREPLARSRLKCDLEKSNWWFKKTKNAHAKRRERARVW